MENIPGSGTWPLRHPPYPPSSGATIARPDVHPAIEPAVTVYVYVNAPDPDPVLRPAVDPATNAAADHAVAPAVNPAVTVYVYVNVPDPVPVRSRH
jgi:hypothetical protein